MISSDFCPLLAGFVSPVDMNLAEMTALLAIEMGELVACVIAPFCCVLIIFKIV